MDNNQPDPAIVKRVSQLPPFLDENGNAVENLPENTVPQEEVENEVPQQEEIEETPSEDEALDNSKNPERTKEYIEKLKKERDEARELAKKEQEIPLIPRFDVPDLPQFNTPTTNEIPSQDYYPNLTQTQIKEEMKSIVDDQGYVDTGLLNEVLKKADERARQAEERAKQAEKRIGEVERRFDNEKLTEKRTIVHQKYPMLDPNRTDVEFDQRLWEAVKNEMVGQQLKGLQSDYIEAADKWYNILYPNMNKKTIENTNAMKNINAIGNKTSNTQRAEIQKGNITKKGQLAERLKASGY